MLEWLWIPRVRWKVWYNLWFLHQHQPSAVWHCMKRTNNVSLAGSAITGPIGKECADLWPRIASAANAIVWELVGMCLDLSMIISIVCCRCCKGAIGLDGSFYVWSLNSVVNRNFWLPQVCCLRCLYYLFCSMVDIVFVCRPRILLWLRICWCRLHLHSTIV
jgi:hypothetical protein